MAVAAGVFLEHGDVGPANLEQFHWFVGLDVAESGALLTGSVPPGVVAAHAVLAAGELLAPPGAALAAGAVAAAPVAGNPCAVLAHRLDGKLVGR